MIDRLNRTRDPLAIIVTRKSSIAMFSKKMHDLISHTSDKEINIVRMEVPADVTKFHDFTIRNDVLITTALCLTKLLNVKSNVLQSERLQSIWYNETDDIRQFDRNAGLIPILWKKQVTAMEFHLPKIRHVYD